MIRELTCIVCPKGCPLKVELEGKEIKSITGYTCRRGEEYARTECTAPRRTLTTTAPVECGGVVPVKTNSTVPKETLFECMELVNKTKVPADAKAGYVVIENILGTGVDVVTTRNVKV